MLLRPLTADEIPAAIDLWEYCFHDGEAFASWFFRRRGGEALAFAREEIIAQMVATPVSVSVRGETRAARILSGVSTHPAHRRQGHMGDFLKQGHAYLRGQGAALGLLYPFDYAFYERYGWRAACDAVRVRAPLSDLPSGGAPGGWRVKKASEGCAGLTSAYGRCFAGYSGHVLRDETYFAIRLEELALDDGCAAVYEADGVPEAYLLYHFDGPTLCVDEIGCSSYGSRIAALSFLANHASTARDVSGLCPPEEPVWRMLPKPRGAAVLEPYAMARILDVEAAMSGLPAGVGEVTLNVRDEHAPWNAGCRKFAARDGKLRVCRAEEREAAPIGIGELTQWALGYLSAGELRARGAEIPEPTAAAMDALLKKHPTFLYEMY